MLDSMLVAFGELRHEPIGKRVRAQVDGQTIVDSVRPLLVYEPRRVVPSFAVPIEDVRAELLFARAADGDVVSAAGYAMGDDAFRGRRVLDPSIPFDVHTADGDPVTLRWSHGRRERAGFVPTDPD